MFHVKHILIFVQFRIKVRACLPYGDRYLPVFKTKTWRSDAIDCHGYIRTNDSYLSNNGTKFVNTCIERPWSYDLFAAFFDMPMDNIFTSIIRRKYRLKHQFFWFILHFYRDLRVFLIMIANVLCASEIEYPNNDVSLLLTAFHSNNQFLYVYRIVYYKKAALNPVFYVRSDIISVRLSCSEKLMKNTKCFTWNKK